MAVGGEPPAPLYSSPLSLTLAPAALGHEGCGPSARITCDRAAPSAPCATRTVHSWTGGSRNGASL